MIKHYIKKVIDLITCKKQPKLTYGPLTVLGPDDKIELTGCSVNVPVRAYEVGDEDKS